MTTESEYINVQVVVDAYKTLISVAAADAYPCADRKLRGAHEEALTDMRDLVRKAKIAASQDGRYPDDANYLLGAQSLCDGTRALYSVWRLLEDGDPHAAWMSLIDAQEHCLLASRTLAAGKDLPAFLERLRLIETACFPPRVFFSPGFSHSPGRCTICDENIVTCEHEEGLIYNGQVCAEHSIVDLEFNHIAIVDNPRDRRACAEEIEQDDGCYLDVLTRQRREATEEEQQKRTTAPVSLRLSTIFMCTRLPPGANL